MRHLNMHVILRLVILAIVALGFSMGLWAYLNGYLTKSKASNSIAHLSFTTKKIEAEGNQRISTILAVTASSGISGIDLSFSTTGSNLTFSYSDTAAHLPEGYELVLDEIGMTATAGVNKNLKRIVLVSRKSKLLLPKVAQIPLYFTAINDGKLGASTTLTVNTAASQIVGVSEEGVSGVSFSIEGDEAPLIFIVNIADPRAASIADLTCTSSCGRNVILKWTDVKNEDGYKVYKDGVLLTTLGKNSAVFPYNWCTNYANHQYMVIAYNTAYGSVSETSPVVSCACNICPTQSPPTPTPIMPTNSADLIFRLSFPDVDLTVNEIPNVRVRIMTNDKKSICSDGIDCERMVTLKRMYTSDMNPTTYFSSPQLQYDLKENRAYAVVIKQGKTIQRTYNNVYLVWKKLLNCLVPSTMNSGCGQLITADLTARPMLSGDIEGLDSKSTGYNSIDINDLTKIGQIAETQKTLQNKQTEGDVNLDGGTDIKDYSIAAKNLNKKGD